MSNNQSLRFKLDTKGPIELDLLAISLNSFSAEFKRKTASSTETLYEQNTKLYITGVSNGSIIADLIPMAGPTATLIAANYHLVAEFCSDLKSTFDFLKGITQRQPTELNKSQLRNVRSILKPINEGNGLQLNITGTLTNHGVINIIVPKHEARIISKRAGQIIKEMDTPRVEVIDAVTLHWYQARNDKFSDAGDKAIVEELSPKPVKVIFANEAIKKAMLLDHGNPFLLNYKVDIVVDTKGTKPTCYRIIELHKATLM